MLVGKEAPNFKCQAIIKNQIQEFELNKNKNKFKVLMFYPLDFSFVCPTELHAFQDSLKEFEKRDAQVLAISVDSIYSHEAWLAQAKSQGGIAGITYPVLSDITKNISKIYDVLDEEAGVAFRALFIIDSNNIIQVAQINNLSLGRNTEEILRLIDAIDCSEKSGDVCPANWSPGDKTVKPTHQGLLDYFKK